MTKKTVKRVTHWTVICIAAFALTGMMTGCRTVAALNPFKNNHPPLMDGRGTVPPAYSEPADVAARAVPVEPVLDIQPDMRVTDVPMLDTPLDLDGEIVPEATVTTPELELPPVVESSTLTYEVQKGDSLWKIGRAYGVTFQELAAYNNLDIKAVLKVGTILRIPPGGKFVPPAERPPVRAVTPPSGTSGTPGAAAAAATTKNRVADANGVYTVRANDNLWLIARSFKTKVSELRSLNNLTSDTLQIGDKLKIPGLAAGSTTVGTPPVTIVEEPVTGGTAVDPTTGTDPDAGNESEIIPTPGTGGAELPPTLDYTISENDTLTGIADMYNVNVQDIINANPGIKTDADLRPGTNIRIPFN
ncbi:MAG: LysM peptidoglycan-binding domain-containing protein [Lentisphaeria bacterium]|nr:LysM peptidoglycan-binding domain-containing protein [Lentisphaeria bacterium]